MNAMNDRPADVDCREIAGWPGYAVGIDGLVWSRHHPSGVQNGWHPLKGVPNGEGYSTVTLHRGGRAKNFSIHRPCLANKLAGGSASAGGPFPISSAARHGRESAGSDSKRRLTFDPINTELTLTELGSGGMMLALEKPDRSSVMRTAGAKSKYLNRKPQRTRNRTGQAWVEP